MLCRDVCCDLRELFGACLTFVCDVMCCAVLCCAVLCGCSLEKLSIKKGDTERAERLADVIAKSIIEKKLSLADAVSAAQQHNLGAAGPASALLTAVCGLIKKRKGETVLAALAGAARENHDIDVLAAVTSDMKDQKAVDAFLTAKGLHCLKPVEDCTEAVLKALSDKKPVAAVLQIIEVHLTPHQRLYLYPASQCMHLPSPPSHHRHYYSLPIRLQSSSLLWWSAQNRVQRDRFLGLWPLIRVRHHCV